MTKRQLCESVLDLADLIDEVLDGSIYADEVREIAAKIEELK